MSNYNVHVDPSIANVHNHTLGSRCYDLQVSRRQNCFGAFCITGSERVEPQLYVSCCLTSDVWDYFLIVKKLRPESVVALTRDAALMSSGMRPEIQRCRLG